MSRGKVFSIRERHPSLEGLTIDEFEGGNSNFTYEAESQFIHVKVTPVDLEDTHQRVIGNFYNPHKAENIATAVNTAPVHNRIVVPRMLSWSDWVSENGIVSSWVDENLRNNYEVSDYKGLVKNNYIDLTEWIARLHSNPALRPSKICDHYEERGEAFMTLLFGEYSQFGIANQGVLQEVMGSYFELINLSVGEQETVTAIHGDLRGDNLLCLKDIDGERFTGVVDFEHGIKGGDRIVDLVKLLQVEHVLRPPAKMEDYMYSPQITDADKIQILDHYLSETATQTDELPCWMEKGVLQSARGATLLDKRQLLITMDNILMVLILRLHEERNGWLETQLNPQFIVGLLKECAGKSNGLN